MKHLMWMTLLFIGVAIVPGCGGVVKVASKAAVRGAAKVGSKAAVRGVAKVGSKAARAGTSVAKATGIASQAALTAKGAVKRISSGSGLLDDTARVTSKGRPLKDGIPQRDASAHNRLPLDRIPDLLTSQGNDREKSKTPRFIPRRP